MPEWALAILIPVGLLAVGLGAFLIWARLGTKEPLKHDNQITETHFGVGEGPGSN
ncbi:hypothetical protein [Streptomyces huiliensis]|uniref:hypothetical protein n=1 Tax=Streptomyces huiliensis TaxID=2876027 RepID=UPI001CBE809F|nr:hypothetical protein [Streptomyces huiliensis]MBZ4320509.1 hypothetical protein [Streptomyces huiliensis]